MASSYTCSVRGSWDLGSQWEPSHTLVAEPLSVMNDSEHWRERESLTLAEQSNQSFLPFSFLLFPLIIYASLFYSCRLPDGISSPLIAR